MENYFVILPRARMLLLSGCAVFGLAACSGGSSGFAPGSSAGSGQSAAGTTASGSPADSSGTSGGIAAAGSAGSAGTSGSGASGGTVASNGSGSSGASGTGLLGNTGSTGILGTTSAAGGDVLGDALHTTGSTLVGTSTLLGGAGSSVPVAGGLITTVTTATGQLGTNVNGVGQSTTVNGLAGLPVAGQSIGTLTSGGDSGINQLAKVTVLNTPIAGSPNPASQQLVNVSVLSAAPANNAALGVGVVANHQLVSVTTNNTPVVGSAGALPVVGAVGTSGPLGGLGTTVTTLVHH
jgi:hypothetical protein